MGFTPFSEIIGQQRAVEFLQRVIAGERIPHAYLFTGLSGSGKGTAALAFTRALNCREGPRPEGCGTCPSCRQVMSGNFPDLQVLSPQGQNIKIQQIRDLNRRLSFKPVTGRYRVAIIREAETLSEEAANSFLKTLEEPVPGNIFILSAVEPLDLLPTIVSRCQRVAFRPVPARDIETWLTAQKGLDAETSRVLARICEGSPGRAARMMESGYFKKRHDLIYKIVRLPGLSAEGALEMAEELTNEQKSKDDGLLQSMDSGLSGLLGIWKTWYRDLMLMKTGARVELLINIDFSHKLKSLAKAFKIEDLLEGFFVLERAQIDLQRSRNSDLTLLNALFSLRRLCPS